MSPVTIDSKQLAELPPSKFPPFLKALISTICAQHFRQTRETYCKEREHLKPNTIKAIKAEFKYVYSIAIFFAMDIPPAVRFYFSRPEISTKSVT